MTRRTQYLRIVFAMLCAACSIADASGVRADFEIESFTRYRIDNFDNNNNGYVATSEETPTLEPLERYAVASEIDKYQFKEFNLYRSPYGETVSRPFFSSRTIRSSQSRAVQLERVMAFQSPQATKIDKRQPCFLTEVSYGMRFSHLNNLHTTHAEGGFLNVFHVDINVAGQELGPYLGLTSRVRYGDWQWEVGGLMQGAFKLTDADQVSVLGLNVIPASILNSPIYAPPSVFSRSDSSGDESVYGEFRAKISRQLSSLVTFSIGYSGFFIEEVQYPNENIGIPIYDSGMISENVSHGLIGMTYTSLEFKR
jgi:hypothetical protein